MDSSEVDDIKKEIEMFLLVSELSDFDTNIENLEKRLDALEYELDHFDINRTIERILKSRA
jgi:hypothetical protein